MTERDQVIEILKKAISPPFKAVMGRGDGVVVVDGRPGYVWCRKLGKTEMLMEAYNRGAPDIEDVIVLVQESRIEGVKGYEVIGVASSTSPGNYYPEVPPHAWTHEWRPGIGRDRVTVYPRAWGYLRAEPIATGSMHVWVTPGWYYYDNLIRWYAGSYSPPFVGSLNQLLYFDPSDESLHLQSVTGSIYGIMPPFIAAAPDCNYPIALIQTTGTYASITENMIEDVRLFMDPIEDCGEEGGMATGILVSLANHTGGLRTAGDVVVTHPGYNESFSGTLVQGYAGKVLVVAETIPSLLTGTLWERGGPFDVETEGVIARNDGLRTSGTLFLAEATASPTGTGVFAVAVSPSAGPTGAIRALFLDELAAPGGNGGGTTTIEIQEDDVKVLDASIINFEGGGGKVIDEGGGKGTVDITGGGAGTTVETGGTALTNTTVAVANTWEQWGTEQVEFNLDGETVEVTAWLAGNIKDNTNPADPRLIRIRISLDNGVSWSDGHNPLLKTQTVSANVLNRFPISSLHRATGSVTTKVIVQAQLHQVNNTNSTWENGYLMAQAIY